jgi:hypothetical protein
MDEHLGRTDQRLGPTDQHLERMDHYLGCMDQQLERMDPYLGRMDQRPGRMDQHLGPTDRHLDRMDQSLSGNVDDVTLVAASLEERVRSEDRCARVGAVRNGDDVHRAHASVRGVRLLWTEDAVARVVEVEQVR